MHANLHTTTKTNSSSTSAWDVKEGLASRSSQEMDFSTEGMIGSRTPPKSFSDLVAAAKASKR